MSSKRILVISHNVFSKTSNRGKTLSSYFEGWDKDRLAQFYVHSEVPTDDICTNYYKITDKEAIRSILTRHSGTVLGENDIMSNLSDSRTDRGVAAKLYQKARSRTPFIYFARNLWWKLGKWKTKKLLAWVNEFNPEAIFLASGDYAFIYEIALKIAKYKNVPLFISCMDDYYLNNANSKRFGGKLVHRMFMKKVQKTFDYATAFLPICDKMGEDYKKLFNKPYFTLHTPATISKPLEYEKINQISYIGNLGFKRNEQLVKLGQALLKVRTPETPQYIDVYSQETCSDILKDLTPENGIRFHGAVSGQEVLEIMGKSLAVIHTESFDEDIKKKVAYSVSTKIADSLASGTPIIAFGPEDIASIKYLKDNNAAFCICSSHEQLEVVNNAIALFKKNHSQRIELTFITNSIKW